MIIFGWGHRSSKNFGPAKINHCENCRNEAVWELRKVSTWFTLFFIPVIPYENHKVLICPVCNCGIELSKEEFEGYKQRIESGEIIFEEGNTSTAISGKTETQLNFLREMEEFQKEKERQRQAELEKLNTTSTEAEYTETASNN